MVEEDWQPLRDLLDNLVAQGFVQSLVPRLLQIVPNVAVLMSALAHTQPAGPPRSELL